MKKITIRMSDKMYTHLQNHIAKRGLSEDFFTRQTLSLAIGYNMNGDKLPPIREKSDPRSRRLTSQIRDAMRDQAKLAILNSLIDPT